jgi:hypothetical protein
MPPILKVLSLSIKRVELPENERLSLPIAQQSIGNSTSVSIRKRGAARLHTHQAQKLFSLPSSSDTDFESDQTRNGVTADVHEMRILLAAHFDRA